jgi:predicted unusual protein kinase regulating ubiquinone biosynthesis (AarF/ABC1/UbiB family)
MNRTLRQPVNFSGNFVTLTNQVATVNATARGMDKNQLMLKQVQPAAQNAVLQNSGIEGRVQVGTQREMQMRAVPVGSKQ